MLEDSKDEQKRREELDAKLDSKSGGKPDRATWGKLPAHQRAMRNAPV